MYFQIYMRVGAWTRTYKSWCQLAFWLLKKFMFVKCIDFIFETGPIRMATYLVEEILKPKMLKQRGIKTIFVDYHYFFSSIVSLFISFHFVYLWNLPAAVHYMLWPEPTSPTFHPTFFLHVWWNVGWKITCFIWRIFWFAHVHPTFHPTFERSFIHKFKFKINCKWRKKFGYHQY